MSDWKKRSGRTDMDALVRVLVFIVTVLVLLVLIGWLVKAL